jgi:hypothetical protein
MHAAFWAAPARPCYGAWVNVRVVEFCLALSLLGAFGCSAGPDPIAFKNRTFYETYGGQLSPSQLRLLEEPYPPLDLETGAGRPYIGVKVLGGTVRLSRPKDWVIRAASLEPQKQFIQYISPREVVFAVYERVESPLDPWRVIMGRYEEDVKKSGGELLAGAVPASTWNAQARVYDVRRSVAAPKTPFVNLSREYLTRSEHRVDLVQIVHQGQTMEQVGDELSRVIQTLQLL